MEIKILFDRQKLDKNFLAGWGVSYLIGNHLLFDTGETPDCLLHNMSHMNVKIEDIKKVVISHDHFEHIGGLWEILQGNPGVDLYVCAGFSNDFRKKAKSFECNIIEVEPFMEIGEGIHTTGQLEKRYGQDHVVEQALVLQTPKGVTIVTGCAHPGIINMVEIVKKHTLKDVYLIIGGFHLMGSSHRELLHVNNRLMELRVEHVGPGHCTGEEAESIFQKSFGKNFIDVKAGKNIDV